MIVMAAFVQLEHRLAGLEMMALKDAGMLELREDAVEPSRGRCPIPRS